MAKKKKKEGDNVFNPQRLLRSLGFHQVDWGNTRIFRYNTVVNKRKFLLFKVKMDVSYSVQFSFQTNTGRKPEDVEYFHFQDTLLHRREKQFNEKVNKLYHKKFKNEISTYNIHQPSLTFGGFRRVEEEIKTIEDWLNLFEKLGWVIDKKDNKVAFLSKK